jgi:formylglycine-generating enzyme required for sulfatase activity
MAKNYPQPFPPPWAEAWGDDRYGLWAELLVKGVTQRLRWVAPGSFVMGSPHEEDGHSSAERPQHTVTFANALWLADTACTQALWQAVMGSNPSYVADDLQKPVEQVSWDDVQGFFVALQGPDGLPAGVEAVLPTEAEWEYACRAGETRAYSFGDSIDREQVNFNSEGYAQKRYESKLTTVPVKALPANRWGLYQMHGNVREWCADALRPYTADAVADPSGATGQDVKRLAVRGGSWFNHALNARSAQRDGFVRGGRFYGLGFRFALRSKSQQPGAGGPRLEGA